MKVTKVECIPFSIPMRAALDFAAGRMAAAEAVLVKVHTDDGLVGIAEAPSRPMFYGESLESIAAACRLWFGPMLAGTDPFDVEGAWNKFNTIEGNHTTKGALDLALHDIIGQALGVPCYRLLGGYTRTATATYVCGLGSSEDIAQEALAMREQYGIKAFKLKVGKNLTRDLKMVRSVREAIPDAHICLDANQGYNVRDAVAMLRAGEELGIAWVEEPCRVLDRRARQRVAALSLVPILGDESCRTLGEVARELKEDTIHMVSIKVSRTGYRVSSRILGACAAAEVRAITGSQGDTGIGTLASLHFCVAHSVTAAQPGELSFFLSIADDLLAESPQIKDGKLTVTDQPGLGIVLDNDKVARYRLS